MGYSITLWLFSAALIIALCCRLTKSQRRPLNPESDPDCAPVESVTTNDRTWNSEDRVFMCQIDPTRFDIFAYETHEAIVFFNSSQILFKEQWALSIRFSVYKPTSASHITCTFSHIGHAQAFYAKLNPDSKISPQNFTLHRLDCCVLLRGECVNRRTITNDQLVFHQHLIDSRRTKFTFEPAAGLGAVDLPPLTFLTGEFYVCWPSTEIILVNRDHQSLYFILYFDDRESADKFFDYMLGFLDVQSNASYNFPDDLP